MQFMIWILGLQKKVWHQTTKHCELRTQVSYYNPCQIGNVTYTYSPRKNWQSEWLRTTYVNLCHSVTTQFERLHSLGSLWTLLYQNKQVRVSIYLKAGLRYEVVKVLAIFSQIEKTLSTKS
jgi:hypothetical protein